MSTVEVIKIEEVDKTTLEKFYKDGMTQKEIGEVIGLPQNRVSYYFKKYDIKARRVWTTNDIEYLQDNYGRISFQAIAKKLNKTPNSVGIKAKRLGLGGVLEATEYLNSSQLAAALCVDRKTTLRWIKENNLKATLKQIGLKRSFWRISLNDFWKWAKKHKQMIRWSKVEFNILGKEPEWVREARKEDGKRLKKQSTKWSNAEDALLTSYWNSELTIMQIAERLKRTTAGVSRRAKRIGLKRRNVVIEWKPIEIETLIRMKLSGALDEEIADELGRSLESVSWKRKKLVNQGKLNWSYRNKKVTQAPTKATKVTL